jgi:hypothetical protein
MIDVMELAVGGPRCSPSAIHRPNAKTRARMVSGFSTMAVSDVLAGFCSTEWVARSQLRRAPFLVLTTVATRG